MYNRGDIYQSIYYAASDPVRSDARYINSRSRYSSEHPTKHYYTKFGRFLLFVLNPRSGLLRLTCEPRALLSCCVPDLDCCFYRFTFFYSPIRGTSKDWRLNISTSSTHYSSIGDGDHIKISLRTADSHVEHVPSGPLSTRSF